MNAVAGHNIQLDGRRNHTVGNYILEGSTILGIVSAPAVDITGSRTHLHRGTGPVILTGGKDDCISIAITSSHRQNPVRHQDNAVGLTGRVVTNTHGQSAVIAHNLYRTIGLEDISDSTVTAAYCCHGIANPLKGHRSIIMVILGVIGQLILAVIAHTKDVVAHHFVAHNLVVIPNTVIVHALYHQGKAMSIVSPAYGDINDFQNVVSILFAEAIRILRLITSKHLGSVSHPLRCIGAQAQLASVITAPSPNCAIVL